MQSALIAALNNKKVSRRTLWLNTEALNEILGGVQESFGDEFDMIKVIVEI